MLRQGYAEIASSVFAVSRFPAFFAPLPKLALGAAAALAAISLNPGSAQAYVVTVGQLQYDVTTFTGSYNDFQSKFALPPAPGVMPWWGSGSSATDFATAVGTGLGSPNFGDGPAFAYGINGGGGVDLRVRLSSGNVVGGAFSASGSIAWAQATLFSAPAASVPGPLPLFGAGAAFGFSRKLRKRIQVARGAQGSRLAAA